MDSSDKVSRSPFPDSRYSSGMGYVHIPNSEDISRNDHVFDCLQNSYLTIYIEGEGQKHQVPCSVNLLNDVVFPEKYGDHGSRIVWVNDPLTAQIYIVAVLSSAPSYIRQEEHSFRLLRRFNHGFVEITGDANTNNINISSFSPTATKLSFSATDLEDSSEISFRVTGKVSSVSSQANTLKSNTQVKFIVEDAKKEEERSFIDIQAKKIASKTYQQSIDAIEDLYITVGDKNEKTIVQLDDSKISIESKEVLLKGSKNITLDSDKVFIKSGEQPMVLGDDLKDMLSSLIDEICSMIIITPTGPGSVNPGSQAKLKLLNIKAKKMLSRVGFLD